MTSGTSTDVLIIGGGLAGASTAYALAKRGIRSVLVEQRHLVAQGASGNRHGLLMPYFSATKSPHQEIYGAGFKYSRELLTQELGEHGGFVSSGGLQLGSSNRLRKLLSSTTALLSPYPIERASPSEASEISGCPLNEAAFYVPDGGFVSPPMLVAALLDRIPSSVSVLCSRQVTSILRDRDAWTTHFADTTTISSRNVVICSAYEATKLEICRWLPLEPIRGQTVQTQTTPQSQHLRTVICFDGYVTPAQAGQHLVGALYRHADMRTDACEQDSYEILDRCNARLPLFGLNRSTLVSARSCFRTSTFDRLPFIGPLPDHRAMSEAAQGFQSGTNLKQRIPLLFHPGMFVSVGHGSRGLLSCPLGGEIIARTIACGDLGSLREIAQVVSAERFAYHTLTTPA